ncbi:hypothetical protein [Marinoscillum sp. 108]|uniref:TerB family tellurite resistance protein n=1 Tax=Marinoscillum luteum TaxID=861051 RepID=A0ABW7N5T2_9BACT|nr:hypothetical protein [Marinoscillum sp. 108]VXD12861.1 conserved hypothetical protein [Marinoscillum sp. 108]
MGWINTLFTNRSEKEHINKLVIIAHYEHIIDQEDILLLKQEIGYISLENKMVEVDKIRKNLPKTARERFNLVFFLVNSLMANGALSDRKEGIVARLLQVLDLSKEKAKELTSFLKLNIRNGLSMEDSFSRLGYLLEPSVYA